MGNLFQGKKNLYLCDSCGHGFITQDADAGTTPMFTTCLNCKGTARSAMYQIPQEWLATTTPAVRWIRPPKEEWGKLSPSTQQHLEVGGLIRDDMPSAKKIKRKAFRP